jgi:hypothetical protein
MGQDCSPGTIAICDTGETISHETFAKFITGRRRVTSIGKKSLEKSRTPFRRERGHESRINILAKERDVYDVFQCIRGVCRDVLNTQSDLDS